VLDRANTIWTFILQALSLLGGGRRLLGFLRLLRFLRLFFVRGATTFGRIPVGRGLMVDNCRLVLLTFVLLGDRGLL
jgi:hypothetical protein